MKKDWQSVGNYVRGIKIAWEENCNCYADYCTCNFNCAG
jgi:hypothetical protein